MIFTISSNLIITTSRKPSQITRRFAQFLKHYFNATYINRGKTSFNKIKNQVPDESKLVIINETKGNPSSINVYDIGIDSENPLYSLYVNVSLPQEKCNINVDNGNIIVLSKTKSLNEITSRFISFKPEKKVKTNCIIIKDDDREDIIATVSFIDKKGIDSKYKVYIRGFNNN